MREKIAIIGASYLQEPLVNKAHEMKLEIHLFAWKDGDVCSKKADFFYPISILEKEKILSICRDVGINAIASIGSDIAMPTVNYIAEEMELIGNSTYATSISTDKYEMRKSLSDNGVSCPLFQLHQSSDFIDKGELQFPVIIKPTDRSGSLAVTKVLDPKNVNSAIDKALKVSLNRRAIVEEFIDGREFSVEMISYQGVHYPLAITDKVTTGEPFFVEIEHHQPANIPQQTKQMINTEVIRALNALQIKYGASHSEVLLTRSGDVRIVEIAGRMGGELIGSDMVMLSTGYDFVKAVIDVSLGVFTPPDYECFVNKHSGVFYVLPSPGIIKSIEYCHRDYPDIVKAISIMQIGDEVDRIIDGAGKRAGIFVYSHPNERLYFNPTDIIRYITE